MGDVAPLLRRDPAGCLGAGAAMDADSKPLALRAHVLVQLLAFEQRSRADIARRVLMHGFNVATRPNGKRASACAAGAGRADD